MNNIDIAITASSSKESGISNYQSGGDVCLLLNRWTGYKKENISDATGLGRWCGFRLKGKNQRTIIVLSAYRLAASQDISDKNCYSQQWRIIQEKTEQEPNPQELFLLDLKKFVKQWEKDDCEVIIGAVMNDHSKKNKK
jgi:hypothetical protein